jgi:MoaA/NifB/PqqE/SkfB family radical SAM enzyme
MTLEDMDRVARILEKHRVELISFFNLGEPFCSNTIYSEISTLIRHNPGIKISLSTNGALIDTDDKIEAALMIDYLIFSIDGPNQDILTKYQVGGNFEKSYTNMMRIVSERNVRGLKKPIIEWKYVVFNWNDHNEHIEMAIRLAREAGVDLILFEKGGAPFKHRSKRYADSAFFQNLGDSSSRGREIWFNNKSE